MLRMMLEAHSRVAGSAEPHILVPLRFSGYLDQPRQAGYDIINASLGLREFVDGLPDGRSHYFEACRAYAGTLYRAAIEADDGARYFVDKTPPNVLFWPFITRLFPRAKYLVLVRHPLAVLDSYAQTFFSGRYDLAKSDHVLSQYIPAVASFLRESDVQRHVIDYQDLVADPDTQARRMLSFLGLDFESDVVHYGRVEITVGSTGDPLAARRHDRPVSGADRKWVKELTHNTASREAAEQAINALADEDLEVYGYSKAHLFDPLHGATPDPTLRKTRLSWYLLQRRVYLAVRSSAQQGAFRRLLERVRYYCDVLLRE